MARFNLFALLAATLAVTSAHAAATCNIDGNTFETADASRACAAIPNQITLTGTTTLLAQSPTNPEITVILQQANVNWSGSGAAAQQLCNQIIQTCGGTVGIAEMNGASIPTGGDFGGSGTISITV